jgi:MFS family permease
MVLAQSIIAETVSPRERGRYQGYFGAAFGLSSLAGPLIGGFITDNLSWRWVFYVNVPFGLVALVVVSIVVPVGQRHARPHIDVAGATCLTASVGLLVLVTTWGGVERPWGSAFMLTAIGLDIVLFALLVVVELRAAEPIIPVRLFQSIAVSIPTAVAFLVGMSLFGSMAFLPLFMQSVTGASATASGLALFPMMGGFLLSSITSGRLITRTGRYKVFPVLGTAIGAFGFGLLATLSDHTPRLAVSAFMLVSGFGLGLVIQVVVIATQNAVPVSQLGAATGAVSFSREVGGSIGIAAFGTVFTSSLTHRLGSSVRTSSLNLDAIKSLPPAQHQFVVHALAESVAHVFVFAVPVMLLAFAFTWAMREDPLRKSIDVALPEMVEFAA